MQRKRQSKRIVTKRKKRTTPTRTVKRKRRTQRGGQIDIQHLLSKTGIEFHPPGYQYLGPGTKLDMRLKRGDPGISRLDKLAKAHDIAYSKVRNLRDKHKADREMVRDINKLKNKKTNGACN